LSTSGANTLSTKLMSASGTTHLRSNGSSTHNAPAATVGRILFSARDDQMAPCYTHVYTTTVTVMGMGRKIKSAQP
jgi:hypothetical protein